MAMSLAACSTRVQVEAPREHIARFVCRLSPALEQTEINVASARILKEEHSFWEGIRYGAAPDTLSVTPGEYQLLMFSTPDPDAYFIENLDYFLDADAKFSLRGLSLHLSEWDQTGENEAFEDFGTLYATYMEKTPEAPEVFVAAVKQEMTEGDTRTLNFTPQQLSQKVTFRVTIDADEDVTPHRVVGCVTGVPTRIEILSGWLNMEQPGQTLFELQKKQDLSAKQTVWEGSLNVLGIRTPDDARASIGSGLLLICAEVGIKNRKVIRLCNLYNYLTKDPLLTYSDQDNFFVGGEKSATYTIESPFVLQGSDTEHSGADPVDEWMNPENGETEPIIDGDDEDHD